MKILLADDERDFVDLLKGRFTNKGYDVDIALDGKRALELIKAKKYDLVFADHNMPEVTGLELIKYIRENKIDTRTVMVTGYEEIEGFAVKEVGADEYVTKPVKINEVEDIVDKYKTRRRQNA